MQRKLLPRAAVAFAALAILGTLPSMAQENKLTEKEAVEIATEAYIYGYSLVRDSVKNNYPKDS